jgi:hypothetical protein
MGVTEILKEEKMKSFRVIWSGEDMGVFRARDADEAILGAVVSSGGGWLRPQWDGDRIVDEEGTSVDRDAFDVSEVKDVKEEK